MKVSEQSTRYSEHGDGYVKIYRKLLTSAVFQHDNLLKVWIWCLVRANWHDTMCLFDGVELKVGRGSFISGRYTGSTECHMKPKTFYNQLVKLQELGNIFLKSDNRKTLITIVNYSSYQDDQTTDGQPLDNKRTTGGQQEDTDKEVKNIRSKEYIYKKIPPSIDEVKDYFLSIDCSIEDANMFFDYYETRGWKVGRSNSPMKNWESACRNWKRNKTTFGGNNGTTRQGNKPNSEQIQRATFKHGDEQIKNLRNLEATLSNADKERDKRP